MSDEPGTTAPEPAQGADPPVTPAGEVAVPVTPAAGVAAPAARPAPGVTTMALLIVVGVTSIVAAGALALSRREPGPAEPVSSTPALPATSAINVLTVEPLVVKTVARPKWRPLRGFGPAFDKAITPYLARDYAAAAQQLQELAVRFPTAPEPFVYGGVSQLLLGHPQEAIDLLQKAAPLTQQVFATDINWYLALAYRAAGRADAAMMELRTLCAIGDDYGARACAAVREVESRERAAREARQR